MSNFQSESCHIRASPRWFISQLTGVHVEVVLSDLCVRFSEPLNILFLLLLSYLNYNLACYKIPGSQKFPSIRSLSKPVFCVSPSRVKLSGSHGCQAGLAVVEDTPWFVPQRTAVCLALYGPWAESLPRYPRVNVYVCKHLSKCIQKSESFPLRKKKPRWVFMRKHHILPRTNEQLRVSQQNSQREFWQKCSWFVSYCAPLMCKRHIPFESLASKFLQLLQNIFYFCCGVPVSPSIVWGVNQLADLFSVLHHSPPTAHSPLSFSSRFWNICSQSRTLIIRSACECFLYAVPSLGSCALHVFALRSAFAVCQLCVPLRDHVTKKWQSQGTTLSSWDWKLECLLF